MTNRLPPDEQKGPKLVPENEPGQAGNGKPGPDPLSPDQRFDNLEFLMFRLLMLVTESKSQMPGLLLTGMEPPKEERDIPLDLADAREKMEYVISNAGDQVWVPGLLHVARVVIENFTPGGPAK